MMKTLVSPQEQRTVIAKMRASAAEHPGTVFEHERIRKTKTRAESNTYRLIAPSGAVIASLVTGVIGLARYHAVKH